MISMRSLCHLLILCIFFGATAAGAESPLSPPTLEEAQPAASPAPKRSDVGARQETREQIDALIKTAPGPQEFPDDAVLILLKSVRHRVEADGTGETEVHELTRVLQEAGKPFSQIHLPYNQAREDLTVHTAQTIKPDGRRFAADRSLVQDTAVFQSQPLFSDLRVRQMVLPNVAVGDFLELRFSIRVKEPIVKGVFMTYFVYPLGLATLESRLTIDLPAAMPAHYRSTLPHDREPHITHAEGRSTYEWAPRPVVMPHANEPAIPPSFDVDPYIFFSTMPSWKTLTEWYVPLFEGALKQTPFAVKDKVRELSLGIEDDRAKVIAALFQFVSRETEYVGVSLGESAWKPYPPDYVLTHGYGDCKGKSALLIAMLRAAGIESYGVLIKPSDRGRLFIDLPSIDFSHLIVAVREPAAGYLYLDPTLPPAPHGFLPPTEEDRDVLILDRVEPHFEKTPDLPVEQSNRTEVEQSLTILEDASAYSEETVRMEGLTALGFRTMVRRTNPSLLEDILERALRDRFPSSDLLKYEFLNVEDPYQPFILKAKARIVGIAQQAGTLLLMDPDHLAPPGLASLAATDTRTYPLFLPEGEVTTESTTYRVPEGYAPKSLPKPIALTTPFGSYEQRYTWDGTQLSSRGTFVLQEGTIPVEKYAEFKQFAERIAAFEKERIVFEKHSAT